MTTSLMGSYTDIQAAQISIQGLFEAVCTNALDTANMMFESEINWQKTADDTNATDATAELVIGWVPRRAKLVSAAYVPNGTTGLTAAASTYATLTLAARPGLTGVTSSLTLGTVVTTVVTSGGSGNWAQWTPTNFAVNAFDPTNNVIPAGGVITFAIAKASTGTVVPKGTLTTRIQFL